MELWYRQPAESWDQALPCGNGALGGMLFGGTQAEHIQLNEESVWSGGTMDRLNPDARATLPEIRELLRQNRIQEAQDLAVETLSGVPDSSRAYQTLGDLYIEQTDAEPFEKVSSYRRSLNLETGELSVHFNSCDTDYTRTVFASVHDQVLVIRLQAAGAQPLQLRCRMTRPANLDRVGSDHKNTIWMEGSTGADGIAYCAMLTVIECDEAVRTAGEFLKVEGASEAILCLAAVTSFRCDDPRAACRARLDQARRKGFKALRARHMAEYRDLFDSMRLELGARDADMETMPTDERLQRYARGQADPGLEALYLAYGRYLLLSSSRPGSLPATLQGLWNDKLNPPWGSRYTININIEMIYWAAAPSGLAACEEPLFDLLERMDGEQTGKRTAREMYGCHGFVAHHNTDLYADTAPQDQYIPASYWVMGAAWLCTHIWRHYTYTMDTKWLQRRYVQLEDCVRFFLDFLQEDEEGYLVTSPSVSPENTYVLPDGNTGCMCIGPTMDNQILRELFTGFLQASKVLARKGALIEQAEDAYRRLRPTQIGQDGRLLEWRHPYQEAEPGHRHISHLYGLYPGREITQNTPALFTAARKTLEGRLAAGGGHTGWSRAWIIGLWARLRDGSKAHENLRALLSQSTFDNLMDNHPWQDAAVFQLDGNLGATAAIEEMLVDSGPGQLYLLPALPTAWEEGKVEGLCICGGATISLVWKKSKLEQIRLCAGPALSVTVHYGTFSAAVKLAAGEQQALDGTLNEVRLVKMNNGEEKTQDGADQRL